MTNERSIHKPGGRKLETVSHFFLTDTDPSAPPSSRPFHIESSPKKNKETSSANANSLIYAIVSPESMVPKGALLGFLLARAIASADIPVGLVETTVKLPHTFFLSGGYKNIEAVYWEADLRFPEFLNSVARLQSSCKVVLLNIRSSALMEVDGLGALEWRYFVPTTVHPESVLDTYAAVKKIAGKIKETTIELVVFKNQSADEATGAATVLEKMTRKFLTCSTRLAGTIPFYADIAAVDNCLPAITFKKIPQNADAAAREITSDLIRSDGLR